MTFADHFNQLIDNHQKEQDMTDAYLVQADPAATEPETTDFRVEMTMADGSKFALNVPATDLLNEDGGAKESLIELRRFMADIERHQDKIRFPKLDNGKPHPTVSELIYLEDILRMIEGQGELFKPATDHVLRGMARKCYEQAASKGFHDDDRGVIEEIALIHSEASEWLEEVRDGHGPEEHYYRNPEDKTQTRADFQNFMELGTPWKPEGQAAEAADIIIRVMDACGNPERPIDIARGVFEKFQYNKTRGHKHGKTC